MIKSFGDDLAETIFLGSKLTKKQRKAIGTLNVAKTQRALLFLDLSTEKDLLLKTSSFYHKLQGSDRYSIDADSRKSPWRITLRWENDTMQDVCLVRIEDTH